MATEMSHVHLLNQSNRNNIDATACDNACVHTTTDVHSKCTVLCSRQVDMSHVVDSKIVCDILTDAPLIGPLVVALAFVIASYSVYIKNS